MKNYIAKALMSVGLAAGTATYSGCSQALEGGWETHFLTLRGGMQADTVVGKNAGRSKGIFGHNSDPYNVAGFSHHKSQFNQASMEDNVMRESALENLQK